MVSQVTVVGGGIIGMLTAYELAHAGVNVAIFDKSCLGAESSWAGGGICSPLIPWNEPVWVNMLAKLSQQYYPALCQHIHQQSGIDPEYINSGMVQLKPDNIESSLKFAKQYQVQMVQLERGHLSELIPDLAIQYDRAMWFPGVYQVRSSRLAKGLRHCLLKHPRIDVYESQEIEHIDIVDDKIVAVHTKMQRYITEQVLLTAGAWSGKFLNSIGIVGQVKPIKGQMIAISCDDKPFKQIILSQDKYIIPRSDGTLLVGSTLEDVGFEKMTTDTTKYMLSEFAYQLFPMLKKYPVTEHWAGLRPMAEKPIICKIPGIKGLSVATGHARNGIATAPATARLVTDMLLENKPALDLSMFQVVSAALS